MDRSIREIIAHRTRAETVSARPDANVQLVVRRMNEAAVGSALILDESDRLLGIFTERDALRRVVEKGLDPRSTDVGLVMTASPTTIGPDAKLHEALARMRASRICHLPVVDAEGVLGVIALRDIMSVLTTELSALTEDLEFENRELHTYIHGPSVR